MAMERPPPRHGMINIKDDLNAPDAIAIHKALGNLVFEWAKETQSNPVALMIALLLIAHTVSQRLEEHDAINIPGNEMIQGMLTTILESRHEPGPEESDGSTSDPAPDQG